MPDQNGNPTEAELRGQLPAGYAPPQQAVLGSQQPSYDQVIGGQHVQIYGNPANGQLSQQQAFDQLNQGNQLGDSTGATNQDLWTALHPNATADETRNYGNLVDQYHASTNGMSLGDKVGNAAQFELSRAGGLIKGVANDPSRLFTGVDPLSTRISNAVTGSNNQALVGQFGGATPQDFNRYEAANGFGSLGAARNFSTAADAIAAIGGAAGASHGLGQAYQGLTGGSDVPTQTYHGAVNNLSQTAADSAAAPAASSSNLGVFANGGAGGLAGVGGGNAGALAASGGISGGAGTGIAGSLGGSGLLSQANIGRVGQLHDLLGGGKQQQGMPMPQIPGGFMGSQPQQQQAAPTYVGLPTNTQMPYIPTKGYRAHNFLGATVWT